MTDEIDRLHARIAELEKFLQQWLMDGKITVNDARAALGLLPLPRDPEQIAGRDDV